MLPTSAAPTVPDATTKDTDADATATTLDAKADVAVKTEATGELGEYVYYFDVDD